MQNAMPLVIWEESKGARLAEAGEMRDMNQDRQKESWGYGGTSGDQTEWMKGQSKNVLRA